MKIKVLVCTLFLVGLLSGCANSDEYDAVDIEYKEWETTKTIDDIKAVAEATAKEYTEDDVIEGYVVSSDEGGVFYKSISFQNEDGTAGFSIPVDSYNLYSEVEPGRKVYIKLKGLYYGIKHDGLVIGDLFQLNEVGRLTPAKFREHIAISRTKVAEDSLVHVRTIEEAKDNKYINTLVEIQGAQFEVQAIGKPFFDPDNAFGGATNYNIEQLQIVDSTEKVKEIVFRTGKYAKFAQQKVPAKRGKVRGVVTKYNTTFQLGIRTYSDIDFTENRFHISTAIGGSAMQFLASVNEDFSSFTAGGTKTEFDKYGNDYSVGERYWSVRDFGGNKYIQLTAYGNKADATKSYFIVPVAFNGNNTLSFKTKDGHFKGNVLNVYYTSVDNYTYGDFINTETFTNITSNFNISSNTTNGYASQFTESGDYNFPAEVNGNGYIIFEYSGTKEVTTTIQIDDIVFN